MHPPNLKQQIANNKKQIPNPKRIPNPKLPMTKPPEAMVIKLTSF
jgi:hypothetical protein